MTSKIRRTLILNRKQFWSLKVDHNPLGPRHDNRINSDCQSPSFFNHYRLIKRRFAAALRLFIRCPFIHLLAGFSFLLSLRVSSGRPNKSAHTHTLAFTKLRQPAFICLSGSIFVEQGTQCVDWDHFCRELAIDPYRIWPIARGSHATNWWLRLMTW